MSKEEDRRKNVVSLLSNPSGPISFFRGMRNINPN
jgi:hypothetical protein